MIEQKYTLSKTNTGAIEQFLKTRKADGLSSQTIKNNKSHLRMFFGRAKKDWDKITKQDIDNIVSEMKKNTREIVKLTLKKTNSKN